MILRRTRRRRSKRGDCKQFATRLDERDADLARRYFDQTSAVMDALEKPVSAQDAKLLMQAEANARNTRNDVLSMLQRRADSWF